MVSNVAQNYHIFKEAEERINIGLAVLVMPPVEVEGEHRSPKSRLHQLLLVTNSSSLIPTSCLEPTVWVEVENCKDHGDHARAHEGNEECFMKLKDVGRRYKAETQKGEIFNNVEAKVERHQPKGRRPQGKSILRGKVGQMSNQNNYLEVSVVHSGK